MTSLLKQLAHQEAQRRRQSGSTVVLKLLKLLSPVQRKFVEDSHRFKLARCSRRSGKTFTDAIYLIKECLLDSNIPTLYVGLTRDSAKGAIWDVLLMILQELNIGHEALGSILRINFPNGSFIQLFGADASNARNRLRGRKYKLIIADEMGFFQAADGLIKSMIPMLADYQGTLCMTSSPGELLTGLFYEADMGEDKDNWSRYSWDWSANPHFMKPSGNPKFKTKGEEELDVICRLQFGGNREHPAFRREYLGLWVEDSTSLIYPARRNNLIDKPFPYDEEEYGIGIDLGSSSDNAIVVVKFGPYNRDVQIIECYKESHLLIDQLAAEIQARVNKYNPIFMVADTGGYGAGIVPELRKRYHLNIEAADKKDKGFYQRIVSNDLLSEYIKVVKGLSILDEWKKLTKDEHGDEIEGPPNHASDAFLYIYRKVYNTYLKTYSPKESEEDKMIKQLTNSIVDKEKKEFWENF